MTLSTLSGAMSASPWQEAILPARAARTPRSRAALLLTLLLAAFPLWWILGLGMLIFPMMAVPMAWLLLRRPRLLLPPGFGWWLLFLASLLAGGLLLDIDPIGTLPGSAYGRLPAYALRFAQYLSVTVIFLFAYNLSERELPQRRLVRLLGLVFIYTVAGGYLGMLMPTFELTAPIEFLLPSRVRADLFVQSMVHPSAAQLMEVFGYATPRPAAPFGYTNTWGNNLSVLLPFFIVGFVLLRSAKHRLLAVLVIAAALVPAVYSLNRALWIGLIISVAYVVVRSVLAGRLAAIGIVLVTVAAFAVMAVATPIAGVFSQRLDNGHSDRIRAYTTEETLAVATQSPILGFGGPRATQGSAQSIAIGQTTDCQRCGNATLGGNGQIFMVLISQGYLGVALYVGFFAFGLWHFRKDRTPTGYAAHLVLLLSLMYMFFYNALVTPLCFYLLAYAVLARNERDHLANGASSTTASHPRGLRPRGSQPVAG